MNIIIHTCLVMSFFFHLFKHCNKIQTPLKKYICIRLELWCIKSLSTICQLYRGIHDYRRGNSCTWRKSLTCRKSLTNFITQSYCCIQYTTSCVGFTRTHSNIGLYEKMKNSETRNMVSWNIPFVVLYKVCAFFFLSELKGGLHNTALL